MIRFNFSSSMDDPPLRTAISNIVQGGVSFIAQKLNLDFWNNVMDNSSDLDVDVPHQRLDEFISEFEESGLPGYFGSFEVLEGLIPTPKLKHLKKVLGFSDTTP